MTTSLPRNFESKSEPLDEYTPIGADRHEQPVKRRRAGNTGSTIVVSALVSVLVVAATLAALSTEEQRAEVLTRFGVQSQFVSDNNRQDAEIGQLTAQLAQQSDALTAMATADDAIRGEISTVAVNAASSIGEVSERVKSLEERAAVLAQQLEDVNKLAAELAKPKPAPVPVARRAESQSVRQRIDPVTLTSVRSQGGALGASLRFGTESSGLMVLGDTWRGYKLVDANPTNRIATFEVDGKLRELML